MVRPFGENLGIGEYLLKCIEIHFSLFNNCRTFNGRRRKFPYFIEITPCGHFLVGKSNRWE